MCSGITNMQWAVINNTILECVQGASRQCQGAIPCPFASVRPGMGHVFAELPGFCQIGDLWVSFWEFDAVAHGIVWGDADAVRCSFIDFVSWNSRIGWICICRCDSIDLCRTCSKCFLPLLSWLRSRRTGGCWPDICSTVFGAEFREDTKMSTWGWINTY